MKHSAFRRYLSWKRLRLIGLVLLLLLAGFTLYLDFSVRHAFEGRRFALPARLYARPLELFPGLKLTPNALVQELTRLGYKEPLEGSEPGRYTRHGDSFEIEARPFVFWDGAQPALRHSANCISKRRLRPAGSAQQDFTAAPSGTAAAPPAAPPRPSRCAPCLRRPGSGWWPRCSRGP